jgi:soluble lytic murein transglycosylase-like protein
MRRQAFGWDVAVLQFLLERHGSRVPIDGYFDGATERAVRQYQRAHGLQVDGIAGPLTLKILVHGRAAPRHAAVGSQRSVRALLEHWSQTYGLDPRLVRALAWMESGYQPGLVSRAGARGVLQVLPVTKQYVETYLLRRRVPWTVSGGIQVGVLYLRELLRRFGNDSLALAAWYQGPGSVSRNGVFPGTRAFVADVFALRRRGV